MVPNSGWAREVASLLPVRRLDDNHGDGAVVAALEVGHWRLAMANHAAVARSLARRLAVLLERGLVPWA